MQTGGNPLAWSSGAAVFESFVVIVLAVSQPYPNVPTSDSSPQFESVLLTLVNKGIILYLVSQIRGAHLGKEAKRQGAHEELAEAVSNQRSEQPRLMGWIGLMTLPIVLRPFLRPVKI